MMTKPARAFVYLLLAYWVTTILGVLLTVIFAVVFNPPTPEQLRVSAANAPAYLMTLPFHPLLNLLVWPWFAWAYLRALPGSLNAEREALYLGAAWVLVTMVVDLIGWVLVPHPWAMTLKEFYVDYQPWITLIYLIIFVSPIGVCLFRQRLTREMPESLSS